MIWLLGLKGKVIIFRKITYKIITNKFTIFFVDCIILLNFLFLSLIGIVTNELISVFEDFTTIIVTTELILKMIAFRTSKN